MNKAGSANITLEKTTVAKLSRSNVRFKKPGNGVATATPIAGDNFKTSNNS